MDEEVINDLYSRAKSKGYSKKREDFVKLLHNDSEVMNDSYSYVKSKGYNKDINSFQNLIGKIETPTVQKKKFASDLSSEDGSLVSPKSPKKTNVPSAIIPKKVEEEEDYFTGAFGNVLRGFDNIIPLGIGDFVDDMARSVASGYRQGKSDKESFNLTFKGPKASYDEIQKFIDANKNAQQMKPSAEMQNYNKIYEKEGKGFWGVVKGFANNPSILPEVILSSAIGLASNSDAIKAGASAIGTGAASGAAIGAAASPEVFGAGAIPGAISGAQTAIPYAFGLASTVVETGATFGELLKEELGDKEFTKENVKAILENPEKYKSIRNKAIARGLIIGTVDALTGKLASGVGAKILSKSAAKSAAGVATKSAVVKSTAAGSAIEALGGSTGEAAARAAIGQDMDTSEIALEGLAELPGGIRSTIQARLAKPSYKVNGEKVQPSEIDDLIETMTPQQLANTKIDIENDYEGRKFKIQDKIVTHSIKEQVRQGNPDLNETSLNAITDLEKQLRALEGNTTQTGKDKASAIKSQIKDIQENQLKEEVKESETLKSKQDAVQEQSTTEVPVQSETGISETVEEGISQPKPEIVTEQVTQEEVAKPLRDVESTAKALNKDLISSIEESTNRLFPKTEDINLIVSEAYHQAKADGSNPELVNAVESLLTPKVSEEIIVKPNESKTETTQPQTIIKEPSITIPQAIENKSGVYVYDGKKGQLTTIGQTVVLETPTEVIDLGNVDELSDSTLEDFGIQKEEELDFTLNEDNSVGINGQTYYNNYSNPEAAISQDKDGNYSVTLDTDNGQKRTFRGQQADQIVYQMKLKNFEQNGTEEDIDAAIELADEAIRTEEEVGQPSAEREGKSTRKAKRKQRTIKSVKKPLTQAEIGVVAPIETQPQTIIEEQAKVSEPQVVQKENVNDLLDLDTKDKGSLKRVYDYLDDLDKALDMNPNELNDVTRVMAVGTAKIIVKTLKTLVNAGITLKEAISRVSEIHSIAPDKIIDALYIVSKINENKSEGVSEMEAPGYNDLSKEIDNMISDKSPIDEVLDHVKSSDVYKNATDVQREALVRDVRSRFGLKEKSAPSVNKLFGKIKDVKKITMTEKSALAKQLRDKARGARESIQKWKEQTQQLISELNDLVKTGKISVEQSSVILNKLAKVNIFSRMSIDKFTDYMTKVLEKADYVDNLENAKGLRSAIKSLSKNNEKNADLRAVGSEFANIDPSMVDNIFDYNEIAAKLKRAIDGSKKRKSNINIVDTVNIEDVMSYVEKTISEQDEKLRQEKINEIQDLFGVDASEFNAEEIDAMLQSDEDLSDDDEKIVRASIKKAFDTYSSMIKEMVNKGKDLFTGEDISFTEEQKDLIKRFMEIDTNKVSKPKEALRMVDSLINFIQNKSTAGMLRNIADNENIKGGESIVKKGLKAIRLRKYWSPKLGRLLGQKTTTLPVLFEKMFKGVTRALDFEEDAGISDLINNSSKAESEHNIIVKEYVNKFYDKKANGEEYNTAYNDLERGVFAHVLRNVIGTESRRKKVFEKRKQEVKETIDFLLSEGNDSEVEVAEILQKVYDKILDGSKDINDVRSKTDSENVNGVEHWVNNWSNKFNALADLSLNFYNKVLRRDLGFTPDRFKRLQDKEEDISLEDSQSQFFVNTDEVLYDKKSGSLMDKQENRKTPKGMYIDFSFDKKNSNAMYDALTDLYTAFDIRKVGSFLKSDNFKKIFPSKKDANIVDERLKRFVRLTRKKTQFSNSETSDLLKYADKIAKAGVAASLASPSQPFKQTIPIMTSTLINAGSLGMGSQFNPDYQKWLNDLGYAISNRGIESYAEIESLNKMLERASKMPRDKALKFMENIQDKALKNLLVKPDVWIARASFKAYYEQYLEREGLKSGNIDYSKHKVNKKAANYAQRMVDRQQHISNHNLAGNLYTATDNMSKVIVKMMMPFSGFRMNQGARLASDLTTLEYWNTSTKRDKEIALRSIAGYAAEAATFRAIQIGFSMLLYSLAAKAVGDDDEEKKEKYKENLLKGNVSSFLTDTFSMLPSTDPAAQDLFAGAVDLVQSFSGIPEEEKFKLFTSKDQSWVKYLGTYGIPIERAKEIYDLGKIAYTGKYVDNYGKEKEIDEDKANELKKLIPLTMTSFALGFAAPDVASISRNAVKIAKKSNSSGGMDMEEFKKKYPEKYKRILDLEKRSKKKFGID